MSSPSPHRPPEAPAQYFAKRRKIYPRSMTGYFRRLKWMVMAVTLGFYYLAPLLRWDRGPGAPDQAILIDLHNIRAYWFFIEIWPQEVYYLTAILVFAAVSLFYVTSLFGRVWCGYLCPQTVWTDLFIRVEEWVQGDRGARARLDNAPWTFEKIYKKFLTHFLWLLIGLCTGGAFVFYFNDAPTLWHQILTLQVPFWPMVFMADLTISTYVMAGFAREQVCIYMCPYARFQSAMFDKDTLVIGYDTGRGEPRGHYKKGDSWDARGHCIDCSACVQVCPMGIDIRKGLQIDCIACGLCIDACDEIMDRVGLPKGLIRYDSTKHLAMPQQPLSLVKIFLRPRSLYYLAVLSLVTLIVLYSLLTRAPYEMHVLHDRNPLFVQLSNGDIRNGYDIKILNKAHMAQNFVVQVRGLAGAALTLRGGDEVPQDQLVLTADPATITPYHIFVRASPGTEEKQQLTLEFTNQHNHDMISVDTLFVSKGGR
jgi:cytochrome c oxidase accessory protein FixG